MKELCNKVIDLVKETGNYIRQEAKKKKQIDSKGKNDFVTHVDKESERRLVNGLNKILPEAGFVAEEGTSTIKGKEYNWIIDPIDGTTNFIHGLAPYAISVALEYKSKIVVGVVYELGNDECFYAWEGSKAYLNGSEISISKAQTVSDSLLATGFPYSNFKMLDGFMKSLKYFMQNSHGLRRLGSAATDLVYVACGRVDGFFEYGLKPYDVAAGAFIVQQAGGLNSDFNGTDNFIYNPEIISANPFIFKELQNIIKSYLVTE